jgi:exopolysaccharide production protein ExoQ
LFRDRGSGDVEAVVMMPTHSWASRRPFGRRRPKGLLAHSPWLRQLLRPVNLAVTLLLFWLTGPVSPLIPNLDAPILSLPANGLAAAEDAGGEFLRLAWYPAYLVVILLVLRDRRLIISTIKKNRLLTVLVCWTILSVLWSVSPSDTLRRSVALALSSIFGLYLGSRFDVIGVVRLLAAALAIDMVASVVLCLAFPAIGITASGDYAGSWRGVFANKNTLGALMGLACLAFYVLYLADRRRSYLLAIGVALCLLLASISVTPLIILLALVPALALMQRFFRNPRQFALLLALAVCGAGLSGLLVMIGLEAFVSLFGRDLTFTGRTDIWELSWNAIEQRIWLGYGYGAFWANPLGPAAGIWDALNWRVPSSHSGLLEIWLSIGFVGVALFCALLFRTCRLIVMAAQLGGREQCFWLLGYFLTFTLHTLTEPTSMEQTNISWVLFVAVACAATRMVSRPKPGPAFGQLVPEGRVSSRIRAGAGGLAGYPDRTARGLRHQRSTG